MSVDIMAWLTACLLQAIILNNAELLLIVP